MPDLATLQTYLAEAEAARRRLLTGTGVASVTSPGGRSVTYSIANLDRLDAYIADLRSQIGTLTGTPQTRRRPVQIVF